MNDVFLERIRKIKRLAESGIGGESENARRMFDDLCADHGIDPSSIDLSEKSIHWFSFSGAIERNILEQCIFHALRESELAFYSVKKDSRKIGAKMTPAQSLRVKELWEHYRSEWCKELKKLSVAFIHRHRIYGAPREDRDVHSLSPQEIEELVKMMRAFGSSNFTHKLKLKS